MWSEILPKPDFESVEEDAVRVVRIDGDALVVPVLRIVAGEAVAIGERSTGRAGDLSPGRAAVGRAVGAELAAARVATANRIGVGVDGLDLRIDVIRVTWSNGDVDPAELISGCGTSVGHTAGGILSDPTAKVGRDRGKVARAATGWHRAFINPVSSVLIQIVLDRGSEAAHADRGDDARRAADVRQLKAGDVLALRRQSCWWCRVRSS